jgi:hypothetical protein
MDQNFKETYLSIARCSIHRDGIEDLLEWLEQTDFFSAPASTRFHGNFESGLVLHSLNVFFQLKKLCKEVYYCEASDESIAIVSLFHDLCKVGCYKTEMRWRKNAQDKWEQYPVYTFKEDFAYGGHGSKSVFLVQSFMKLTPEEASAINCHMGQWDSTNYSNPTTVYERNLLAWLLHVADEAADFVMESKKEV